MCATCTEPARRAAPVPRRPGRGFTLPELVAVLVLVGVLAAVAVPRLQGSISLREDSWREEVVAALRLARQVAVSHRRLVCTSIGAAEVQLTIAAAHPASACTAALPGVDGSADATRAPAGVSAAVVPAGTLYFQPDGRVTSDGAGTTVTDRTVTVTGAADIVVVGATGHVR